MQVIEEFKKATEENELAWFNELEETYGNDYGDGRPCKVWCE